MILIDTHNHILPGIDDGAKDLDESVKMCQVALEDGIKTIVATPHFIVGECDTPSEKVRSLVATLNHELIKRSIELQVLVGHEVYVDLAVPKLLVDKHICSINDSKYLLIELPMHGIPRYMEDLIYSIKLKGYTPIIAHPERNTEIIEDPNLLYRFIELGALSQLTTWSVLGKYGKRVQETANLLLEHNMYHLMATDAHSSRSRRPKIQEAIKVTQGIIGMEKTEVILNNAQLVISNQELILLTPKAFQKPKGLRALLKKLSNKK